MLALLLIACLDDKLVVPDSGAPESEAPDSPAPPDDTGTDDSAPPDDSPPDSADLAWASFEARREEHLRALAAPIAACVQRSDTSAPAFDGCVDWHSAVHGHWALLALARVLDEPEWADLASASFTPEALEGELALVESGRLWEIPYGYAWFLALARERRLAGETDLDRLAESVAAGLSSYLSAMPPERAARAVAFDNYENLSWAVLNLHQWGEDVGDADAVALAEQLAREVLVPTGCPLEEEIAGETNFFPACLMRAHAVLRVLPPEETAGWLAALLPDAYPLEPVTQIRYAHLSGLNFSRSWGLWTIYAATGDPAWRELAREHIQWHLDHPEYWAEDYMSYSHWVAQFGVYAILGTMEPG